MDFTSWQLCPHEITRMSTEGSSGFCTRALRTGREFAKVPWPALDGGRGGLSGTFSPAARSPAGKDRPSMTYGTSGACWWVMCSRNSGGARPAARNGGGRGGVLLFVARGQRTWTDETRMSTVGMWGCDCSTQFGRRWVGRGLSTVRWTSGFNRR
jgi:hypothetical protein